MFRLKIALLSVLLSGAVLVGLGLYSLSVINKLGMARIDNEILTLGEGHLATRPSPDYWQNFATSLRFIYGEERSENLIVQIKDSGNKVLFKSPHWPAEITADSFPGFDRTMDTRPPAPAGRDLREVREERAERVSRGGDRQDRQQRQDGRDGREARAEQDGREGQDRQEAREGRGDRRGPPPEAYEACAGKKEGMTAQFVDQRGETIKGTCEKENGNLVLRPDFRNDNRQGQRQAQGRGQESAGDRQEQAQVGRPGDSPLPLPNGLNQQPGGPVPRIKKKPFLATLQTTSGVWRTGIMGSDRITMMVGVNMTSFYDDEARYRRAFLGVIPIVLLLLAGGGWLIAQRALKPVARITRTAEAITARALDQRVPLVGGDSELSRLVEVINGMLDRLEKSFGQAVRFSLDAAHELQTPLTILQGELDDAVQHAIVGSEEQQRYSGLLEEVQRLKAIVQKLLILARADAGRLDLRLTALDLSAMIEAAAEDAGAIAPHLQVEKQIAPGVTVKADSVLMGQVIRNLTSNAVKYNHENGLIRFQLSVRDEIVLVTIANTGAPIPGEDREKIFDRFYRVDQSRSKSVSGSGLGLSLAREIVHAHHGELRLDADTDRDSDPGNPDLKARRTLVSFTLSLPCSS